MTKVMKGLGYGAAIVAFLGGQFWGVPYYISIKVKQEVQALNSAAGTPPEVTQLLTRMDTVDGHIVRLDGSVVRVEGKIDDLSGLFVGYLERQASRE